MICVVCGTSMLVHFVERHHFMPFSSWLDLFIFYERFTCCVVLEGSLSGKLSHGIIFSFQNGFRAQILQWLPDT